MFMGSFAPLPGGTSPAGQFACSSMRMSVVVAVTGGGVVRGFVVRMAVVVVVAVLLIVGFGSITNIAIGMGGSVLMFGRIGTGGLAASEEQGGEGKRCEQAFHWILGFEVSVSFGQADQCW